MLSYLGFKFQINRSLERHQNTGQQRLYEFCYLLPFDLWTSYLARILFLKGCGRLFWESPNSPKIFNGLQNSFHVWQRFIPICRTVGEIISLQWFSKELKNDLSKNNSLRGVILILLVHESIFVGWGSPFPIVLVLRYKLSLCRTLSNLIYLAFRELVSLRVFLRDHVVTRFALAMLANDSEKTSGSLRQTSSIMKQTKLPLQHLTVLSKN